MTDNTLEKMLNALRGSVASTDTAPAETRQELLNKSFEEFGADIASLLNSVAHEAFDLGVRGDLRKFVGSDDPELQDAGIGHVAETANLMRSVESAVDSMTKSYDDKQLNPETKAALVEWTNLGKSILGSVAADFADVEDHSVMTKGEAVEELKKRHETLKAAVVTLRKRANTLLKDDGGDTDPSQMDPLEVIGRLAAAILVQIDALMPDDDDQGGDPDAQTAPGAAPGATPGATPPNPSAPDTSGAAPPPVNSDDEEKKKTAAMAAAKSVDTGDLAKRATDLQVREEALKKREEEFAKKAAPTDKPLKVVGKDADDLNKGKTEDIDAEAERLSKMPEGQRALELTKRALRRPVVVL